MAGRPVFLSLVASLAAVGVVTACEPTPPRSSLAVTSSVDGADDSPGDGVCSSSAAEGACTLLAALEEGDLAPDGVDITVAPGRYQGLDATITGDVRLDAGSAAVEIVDSSFHVAPGGSLSIRGVNAAPSFPRPNPFQLSVAGVATVERSVVGRVSVAAGVGLLRDTVVVVVVDVDPAAVVDGTLVAVSSSLLHTDIFGGSSPVLAAAGSGSSHLRSSVVARPDFLLGGSPMYPGGGGTCSGAAVSYGSVHVEVPCIAVPAAGDGSGDSGTQVHVLASAPGTVDGYALDLEATSPLVDAIPLGQPGCDPSAVDLYGRPRGVDGDGDGVRGCDIGAVERQP